MPLTYTNLKEEHHAVRRGVGMFDVSHMGEFIVRGAGARDLVQFVTSNDVDKLEEGQAQYSCFPRPEGGKCAYGAACRAGPAGYRSIADFDRN